MKVLLFVGTNFHAVILGFSNSWFQTLQATIDEKICFPLDFNFRGFMWSTKSTEIKTPQFIMKAIFFVGINFRGLVRNCKFLDSWCCGFCVCTQNKVCGLYTLYFQHIKFHWVADLRESFHTLDRCQAASQVSLFFGFLISWTIFPRKLVPHK